MTEAWATSIPLKKGRQLNIHWEVKSSLSMVISRRNLVNVLNEKYRTYLGHLSQISSN